MTKIDQASQLLQDATLAILNGEAVNVYHERGIKTLLDILESEPKLLAGATVADKVVGKAAALVMVKGGVKEVYAELIGESAIEVLRSRGIPVIYGAVTARIMNRAGTGPCPMESAVWEIDDPAVAVEVLLEKRKNFKPTL